MGPSTNDGGTGILAIWNNCAPGHEAEYEHWYQTEHLAERVSVPGFLRGRRYESVDGKPTYFTYYEVESPEVLQSDLYVQRIDNPTPMTKRIMSGIFTDMSRTVCRRVFCIGDMRGAFAATVLTRETPTMEWLESWIQGGEHRATLARVEVWQAVSGERPEQSYEERLRGGDRKITSCLLVEALREVDCRAAVQSVCTALEISNAQVGVYRLLCEMTSQATSRQGLTGGG